MSRAGFSTPINPRTTSTSHMESHDKNRNDVMNNVWNTRYDPFSNLYLTQNSLPLSLPQVSYSVQQRNASLYVPKNNPNEYTIGGVLSGSSGIDHKFTQVLSVSTAESFHVWWIPLCIALRIHYANLISIEFTFSQDLELSKFAGKNVTLNNAIQQMDTNPIKTAITVCSQLIEHKVKIKTI